jgi:hypothetical protein
MTAYEVWVRFITSLIENWPRNYEKSNLFFLALAVEQNRRQTIKTVYSKRNKNLDISF